ncbi:hypothetical protein NQU54_02975 [Streptomyces samsunensis]|uniref:Uncharacterized protein n=1 Tax=Streptomyces malaysiensis subsp. samsunensis TaxID=459658 RepID=A0A9X2LQS1_STRMQ|nr:hypothetical protein [Streptomyces samsunensis]MCQ8828078.1 hypothetical protein [Streptomyces samsunensis]
MHSSTSPLLKMPPTGLPSCGMAPKKPRRSFGTDSIVASAAPAYSPPRPMPCNTRRNSRMTGAAAPIVA